MQNQSLPLSNIDLSTYIASDLSQIRFSLSRIFLPQASTVLLKSHVNSDIKQNQPNRKIVLRLKFYSANQNCKLIQKTTKVAISPLGQTSDQSCYLVSKPNMVNFKVIFPRDQQYEILGKIFVFEKKIDPQNKQIFPRLIGTFKVDLLEWLNQTQNKSNNLNQNGSMQGKNPQQSNLIKNIQIDIQNTVNPGINEPAIQSSSLISNFKKIYSQQNSQSSESLHGFTKQQNITVIKSSEKPYISFKTIPIGQKSAQCKDTYILQKSNRHYQPKNLQFVGKIYDLKISKDIEFEKQQKKASRIKITSSQSFDNTIQRIKSQIIFKKQHYDNKDFPKPLFKHRVTKQNKKMAFKPKQKLSFQQKIYQLLKQVRNLKKDRELEEQNTQRRKNYENNRKISSKFKQNELLPMDFLGPDIRQTNNTPFILGKMINSIEMQIQQQNADKNKAFLTDVNYAYYDNNYSNARPVDLDFLQNKRIESNVERQMKLLQLQRLQQRLYSYENVRRFSKVKAQKSQTLKFRKSSS